MKVQLIFDAIWILIMMLGVSIGRFTGDITGGEFYLGLLLAMFVGRWMIKDDIEELTKEERKK